MTSRQRVPIGVVLTLAFAIVTGASIPGTASAHLKTGGGAWYFEGGIFDGSNANATGRALDPVNILYYRGGQVTPRSVTAHVAQHTIILKRRSKRRCVGGKAGFNCQDVECNGATQYLPFINHKSDRRPGAPRRDPASQTFDLETACGGDRLHSRLWDDSRHDDGTLTHRRGDWVVGNIHSEKDVNGGHVPGIWEDAEGALVRALDRTHCVKNNWRYHPGSHRKGDTWRGRANNGKISLVTLAHNGAGACAPETN